MMRQESYVSVEIPRLRRTVLVCDQVGEATYIVRGYVPTETLRKLTKDELLEQFPKDARKVVRTNPEVWHAKLSNYLTTDEAWELATDEPADPSKRLLREKINVHGLLEQREKISAYFRSALSPQQWLEMTLAERAAVKVGSLGLRSIAVIFCYSGDISRVYSQVQAQLELAQLIFPESTEIAQAVMIGRRSESDWVSRISKQFTAETWASMLSADRSRLVIDGIGYKKLAGIFGMPGQAVSNRLLHLEFGKKLFPTSELLTQEIALLNNQKEVFSRTPEMWKIRIREVYSPEQWAKLKVLDRQGLKIDGKGLDSLATILGAPGQPNSNEVDFFRLGAAVFPDSDLISSLLGQAELKDTAGARTGEQWITRLRQLYTPEQWVKMRIQDREQLKPDGVGLVAIARILGHQGNPVGTAIAFYRLGLSIFGDDNELIRKLYKAEESKLEAQKRTPQEWRMKLQERFSPEEWVTMSADARSRLKVDGIGVNQLATIFGVEGKPNNVVLPFLKLGEQIYPENEIINQAIERAMVKAEERRGK